MTSVAPVPATFVVRDCLGRERVPDKVWPDGTYTCPFCLAAAPPAGCPNPACFARVDPPYPIEEAKKRIAEAKVRKKEEDERAANAAWSKKWREEQRQERDVERQRRIKEADERGACVRCMLAGGDYRPPKFIKHRGPCPRERRS